MIRARIRWNGDAVELTWGSGELHLDGPRAAVDAVGEWFLPGRGTYYSAVKGAVVHGFDPRDGADVLQALAFMRQDGFDVDVLESNVELTALPEGRTPSLPRVEAEMPPAWATRFRVDLDE